jgi:hypothetical protein
MSVREAVVCTLLHVFALLRFQAEKHKRKESHEIPIPRAEKFREQAQRRNRGMMPGDFVRFRSVLSQFPLAFGTSRAG